MPRTAIFPAKVPRVPGFDPALCAALILSFICKLPLSFKNSSCYVSYSFQNSLLVFQKNLKKLNVLVCNRIRTKLHRNSWRLILTSLLIPQAQEILISNIAMGLLWLKFADVCRPPIFKKSGHKERWLSGTFTRGRSKCIAAASDVPRKKQYIPACVRSFPRRSCVKMTLFKC